MRDPSSPRDVAAADPRAWQRLLDALDADPARAAERYAALRERLVRFFVWERCAFPDDLADEALERMVRRLAEGVAIGAIPAYALGVARLVALEARQRQARAVPVASQVAEPIVPPPDEDEVDAMPCLDACLGRLTQEQRALILGYYAGDHGARIAARRAMSRELGVAPVALRNRALRLRQQLLTCMERCLAEGRPRDGSGRRTTQDVGATPPTGEGRQ